MLFKSEALEKVVVEKLRGGIGEAVCSYAFMMGKAPEGSAFQMLASQVLMPGNSVGFHKHTDNEEIYVFLSGQGTFYDNDEKPTQVGPGDMTITTRGQSHGLVNTGNEPLKFLAVVAKN